VIPPLGHFHSGGRTLHSIGANLNPRQVPLALPGRATSAPRLANSGELVALERRPPIARPHPVI